MIAFPPGLPESYVHDAELAHRAMIEYGDAFPEHRPVLTYHGPPDSLYLGTPDQAIAAGVLEINDDAMTMIAWVTERAPGTTYLMLWCAWELVFPELAKGGAK